MAKYAVQWILKKGNQKVGGSISLLDAKNESDAKQKARIHLEKTQTGHLNNGYEIADLIVKPR